MGTQKWRVLRHVCDLIGEVADLVYLHAGLFESSYKRFKEAYSLGSKRPMCVVSEVMKKRNRKKVSTPKVSESYNSFGGSMKQKEMQKNITRFILYRQVW